MFGLFNRKDNSKNQAVTAQEPEYTCLFCKQKFKAEDIIFGRTLNRPEPEFIDNIFNNQLRKYQHVTFVDNAGEAYGLVPISRRMVDKSTIEEDGTIWEKPGLPLMVKGKMEKSIHTQEPQEDNLSFDEGITESNITGIDEDETSICFEERLCPHCHFTLPEGFADEQVIQVGLLGGSRSGKTTYMAVVTEYLLRKMGMLESGLELAQVELLPECQKYQEALYLSQRSPIGAKANAVVGDTVDKMVMPIILHIKPVNKDYRPFFVILQDIPGEYLLPKNKGYLLNSNIPKSTELILLVDINHFIKTTQQDDDSEFGDYCKQNVNELFSNIDTLGKVIPEGQLNSVQCTLTKLDFWISGEKSRLDGAVFTSNCDDAHRDGINVERLGLVHDQINQLLNGIGGKDQSGLLDNLVKSMNLENSEVHKAYTAVASRIVPGHENVVREQGADYQSSLNVLEPLINIFEWGKLLPVKNDSDVSQ